MPAEYESPIAASFLIDERSHARLGLLAVSMIAPIRLVGFEDEDVAVVVAGAGAGTASENWTEIHIASTAAVTYRRHGIVDRKQLEMALMLPIEKERELRTSGRLSKDVLRKMLKRLTGPRNTYVGFDEKSIMQSSCAVLTNFINGKSSVSGIAVPRDRCNFKGAFS